MIKTIERCKPLLGTFVEIAISAPVSDKKLASLSTMAFCEIEKIHKLMSFHDPDSELSKVNREAFINPVAISPATEWVIQNALELSAITSGSYDITIASELMQHGGLPPLYSYNEKGSWRDIILDDHKIKFEKDVKIDLGGIAKGFAVDNAMAVLSQENIDYHQISINAGGDLRLLNWEGENVNIRHPSAKRRNDFINVPMQGPAMATSAPCYTSKNSLIIDPESGKNKLFKNSVSVFADKCMLADALTKIVFLSSKYLSILDLFHASGLSIDPHGQIRHV